jgi:hypothetical protein
MVAADRTRTGTDTASVAGGSWLDRLQATIESLPGPWWAWYVAAFLALQVLGHALRWADGSMAVWTIDPWRAPMFGAFFPAFILGSIHFLDRLAARQLAVFRPALDVDDVTYDGLRTDLTTLPAAATSRLTIAAAVVPTILYLATAPLTTTADVGAWALGIILVPLTIGSGAVLYLHTIHQLRVVDRLHRRARDVDVFRPQALTAFSVLASWSGVVFLVLAYYAAGVRPDLILTNPVGVAMVAVTIACGLAAFVLPLVGLHDRLAAEKRRLVSLADDRLRAAVIAAWDETDGDAGSGTAAEAVGRRLENAQRARGVVGGLSTWPWSAGTVTGFASAVLVPIGVWAITRLLEELLA